MASKEDRARVILEDFFRQISEEFEALKQQNKSQSKHALYFKRIIEDFEVIDGELQLRKYYDRPEIKKDLGIEASLLARSFMETDKYRSTVNRLEALYDDSAKINVLMEHLIDIVALEYISTRRLKPGYIKNKIDICIGELKGVPQKYGANVELVGVTILKKRQQYIFDNISIVLRQVAEKDLEIEERFTSTSRLNALRTPTMMLEIKGYFGSYRGLQERIEQAKAILRLFKVGSVTQIRERYYSESLADYYGGIMLRGSGVITPEKYIIREEETAMLRAFWKNCLESIPSHVFNYDEPKTNFLGIAYKRYCDSLLERNSEEGRIATIIMGLESLFLDEKAELRFLLKTRIAKIFGILGFDPIKVSDEISRAYDIRSDYVHGKFLSERKKNRIINEYKEMSIYINYLSNILRISILITCHLKMSKKSLNRLISESLIDSIKEKELRGKIRSVTPKVPILL